MNRAAARANLVRAVRLVLDATKTVGYYDRALSRAVLELYRGDMGEGDFTDELFRLVDEQFDRAWNEGMRANGLDPEQDMTDEWEQVLEDAKARELDFIEGYAADITAAAENGDPVGPLQDRAALWANRYNEIVNLSKVTTGQGERYEWQLGATEEHCETCAALNGIVAFAEEWEQAGLHPQGAPNDLLECGGWRCDCSLEPTDKRRTADALSRLMDIATAGNV